MLMLVKHSSKEKEEEEEPRMSQYTWKDLLDLNSKERSFSSGLSCIAHIDMNAFFAQVEQIRCGFTEDDPVVCVQWNALIAVSYAARKYGIGRMDTVDSARVKCPHVLLCHAAVFKKNENYWEYKPLGVRLNAMNYKVSLEPYRREGRKVLKIFKKYTDLVEKASVDEAFIDLGKLIFQKILISDVKEEQAFCQVLRDKLISGDYQLNDKLPSIFECLDVNKLHIDGLVLNNENKPLFQDWDDVVVCLGSNIAQGIRTDIKQLTGYTTSCGVSQCKSISKLASDFKKPDAQTIVFRRLSSDFLDNGKLEITSFWTLGGARGKDLLEILNVPKEQGESIKYIRDTWDNVDDFRKFLELKYKDYSQFKKYSFNFEDCISLSSKVFAMCRGEWKEIVNPKPVVKTMMANKNMRGRACSNASDCVEWFRVFSGELADRIIELEREYNKVITPRTISIGLIGSQESQSFKISKSGPFFMPSYSRGGEDDDEDGGGGDQDASAVANKRFSEDILKQGTRLMMEIDKTLPRSVYPLRNLNLALSNMTIVESGGTIFEMLKSGGTDSTTEPRKLKQDGDGEGIANDKEDTSNTAQSHSHIFYCDKCEKMIDGVKQKTTSEEHMDFHYATELSRGINGYNEKEDFESLSYGEKRLLFKSAQDTKTAVTKHVSASSSKTSSSSSKTLTKVHPGKNNILSFFNVKKPSPPN